MSEFKTNVFDLMAHELVRKLNQNFNGDGCSFFVKEEGSEGRYRLVATNNMTRFVGTETIDAFDQESLKKLESWGVEILPTACNKNGEKTWRGVPLG